MPKRRVEARAAALVFALLVLASVAAFAWAQRLKRDPLVLDRVNFVGVPREHRGAPVVHSFSPNGDCRFDRELIRFRVTQSDDATVQVVRPGGRAVITLARDKFLKRYHVFTFYWDGRQRGGGVAPPGHYKLRVKLLGQDRLLVPAPVIRLRRSSDNPPSHCPPAGSQTP